jgi:hypothetical protein
MEVINQDPALGWIYSIGFSNPPLEPVHFAYLAFSVPPFKSSPANTDTINVTLYPY